MGLLDYFDPDRLKAGLQGLLGRAPIVKALHGERGRSFKQALLDMPIGDAEGAYEAALNVGPMMLGKIVYHGSPYKFDKFDASKIGTGEGAQAYGHGVYLADAEDVAKGYQKTLAYKAFDLGPEAEKRGLKLTAGARGEFHRQAAANRDPMRAAVGLQNANISARDLPQEKLAELFDAFQKDGAGALYKADLPDEWIPKMLDWDKPLSQQPENVRLLAQDLGLAKDATGKDVYSALSNQARDMGIIKGQTAQTTLPGSQGRAAADLSEFGIPGIRYLDGGSRPNSGRITMLEQTIANLQSRGASKAAITNAQRELDAELARASYNYVVFPGLEDQIKILERNGIPLTGLLSP